MQRILTQQTKDKNKLYALHAPEVECISKGKARTPYEFGVKVSVTTTLKEGLVLGCRSMPGNPLKGALGDALHAVMCGAGHNIRLLLKKLRLLCALWGITLRQAIDQLRSISSPQMLRIG